MFRFSLDERFLFFKIYHHISHTIILYFLQTCILYFIRLFVFIKIYYLKVEKNGTKSMDKMEKVESMNNVSFLLFFPHAE